MSIDPTNGCQVDGETIAWWHMSCGRVLGVYDGRLIEYEPSTLAPLGLVVGYDELEGKEVVVVGSGIEECKVGTAQISTQEGMEGADCADNEDLAVPNGRANGGQPLHDPSRPSVHGLVRVRVRVRP